MFKIKLLNKQRDYNDFFYVIHCKWDVYSVESNCEIATNERFLGANGLTLNKHRTRLFVNDPLAKTVTVYTITDHGGKNVLRKEENIGYFIKPLFQCQTDMNANPQNNGIKEGKQW